MRTFRLNRRELLDTCTRCTTLGAIAAALPSLLRPAAAQQRVPSKGTHLVLLGTQGGPNFRSERGEAANAVVVDGRTYLVDLGEGGLSALQRSGLGYRDIGRVFLTHLHDDHTSGIASFLTHQWTDGRIEPTVVGGPYGTSKLVAAALEFSAANVTIRFSDEGRAVKPTELISGEDYEATSAPTEVYRDDRVVVSAVENTHFSAAVKRRMPYRSLSYRFDTEGRSIVFSGDTNYSAELVKLARGADVFVCEALEIGSERREFEQRIAAGAYADNPEGVWQHIVAAHTSTVDAGRMAAEANVGTLVLSHLLPGALLPVDDAVYLEGVRRYFHGAVVVGQDLEVL